jgi:plasmid maintenance system antidote protein VapI
MNTNVVPVTSPSQGHKFDREVRGATLDEPDTALRLGRYFNTSARFWLNAQSAYELEVAQDELQPTIERDVRPPAGTAQSSRA